MEGHTLMAGTENNESRRPIYAARKVGELPEDATLPRKGPRTDPKFTKAMLDAQADPTHDWWEVGWYKSDNGAKHMAKRIDRHEVKIPAGRWEMDTRRVDLATLPPEERKRLGAPDSGRWSVLYAKYVG